MIIEYKAIESAKRASQKLNIASEILKSSGIETADEVDLIIGKLEGLADFNETILEIYTELLNEVEEGFMFLRIDHDLSGDGELVITTIDAKHEFVVGISARGIDIIINNKDCNDVIAVFVEDEVEGAVALIDRMLDGFNDVG